MDDQKIAVLMEETGCDADEAKMALEMCGYQLSEAVKTIARLMRNILVLKGKFSIGHDQFGLVMAVLNVKSGSLLRSRAVLSYNPAVYDVALDRGWFEFEKHLYSCRLWEGSLQTESLEIERALADHFRCEPPARLEALGKDPVADPTPEVAALLRRLFKVDRVPLRLKKEVLDLGRFQSLSTEPGRTRSGAKRAVVKADDLLVLRIALEEDRVGIAARDLRVGDMVSTLIIDPRDIGQYLARLFGGHSDHGPVPVLAPVEAVETEQHQALVRVRFSVGVCGDASVSLLSRLKIVRIAVRHQETHSWWRRFFKS